MEPKTSEELQKIAVRHMAKLMEEVRGPNEAAMIITVMAQLNMSIFCRNACDSETAIIMPW